MWFVVIVFIVHCVTAFFLSYCFDAAELWKDDEKPTLKTPSVYDLTKDCDRHTIQKYIDEQIIPARDYFSLNHSIENMQDDGVEPVIVYGAAHIVPSVLIGYSLFKMDVMPKFLCFIIPLIVCIAFSFLAHLIYKKSRLVIYSNRENRASLRKEYDIYKECHERSTESKDSEHSNFRYTGFKTDEEADFNNFIIYRHNSYLECVHITVKRRYYVRKCFSFVCFIIYALFIMRVPD